MFERTKLETVPSPALVGKPFSDDMSVCASSRHKRGVVGLPSIIAGSPPPSVPGSAQATSRIILRPAVIMFSPRPRQQQQQQQHCYWVASQTQTEWYLQRCLKWEDSVRSFDVGHRGVSFMGAPRFES